MGTNLIQNFINRQIPVQNNVQVKPKPNFDINYELNNRTFIKPLKGKGKLLSGNIFNSPRRMFDSVIYDIKSLKHGLNGQANDHELGKLNDVGLKMGGLGIASYLATKRTTGLTRGMEFVGLASFLGSMVLWPKIAIQLPAYLIHGVNVHKQYKDSFGRVKPFYQDPQFIPWDLYSDKEIDKIGNRLGVPKNIPNRRDFVQEKMRKLAVQNNTLWMLTAGFATPVMSALICNQVEPYLLKFQNDLKNKKADKILSNIDKYSEKYQDKNIEKNLTELFKAYSDRPIDNKLLGQIEEIFTTDLDVITSESLKRDLKRILVSGEYTITENTPKTVVKNIIEQLTKYDLSEGLIEKIVANENEMLKLFKDNDFIGKSLKKVDLTFINNEVMVDILKRFRNSYNGEDKSQIEKLIISALNSQKQENQPVRKAILENLSSVLSKETQAKLIEAGKVLDLFRAENFALDECAVLKIGSAPETVLANYWNNIQKDFLNILGISQKDIEHTKFDRSLMGKLLRDKIESIVSNKTKYESVMQELVSKVAQINEQIKTSDMSAHMLTGDYAKTKYETAVDTVFNKYASQIKDKGFTSTAEALIGSNEWEGGTLKHIQKAYVEERILGVKSSFYRLINTLDFYRRIAVNPNGLNAYNIYVPRETMEELIELCKITTLQGHSSDFATKLYFLRNPHPADDYTPVKVKDGKVQNKYYGKVKGTDIPGDKYFYQNAMKFMFGEELSPETKAILDNSILRDEVINYRKLIMEKLGGDRYFWKPNHLVSKPKTTGTDIKFLLTGIAPDEFFLKSAQQMYNTKKWLKIFGGFGAGLLGVTVLAQFFLGRIKNPQGGKK